MMWSLWKLYKQGRPGHGLYNIVPECSEDATKGLRGLLIP